MTQQCALTAQKANHMLGCFKSRKASSLREAILPFCFTLVRSHLEPCVQLWSPQHMKDLDLLERGRGGPSNDLRAGTPLL